LLLLLLNKVSVLAYFNAMIVAGNYCLVAFTASNSDPINFMPVLMMYMAAYVKWYQKIHTHTNFPAHLFYSLLRTASSGLCLHHRERLRRKCFVLELDLSQRTFTPLRQLHSTPTKELFLKFGKPNAEVEYGKLPKSVGTGSESAVGQVACNGNWVARWMRRYYSWAFPDWKDIDFEKYYRLKSNPDFYTSLRWGLLFQAAMQVKDAFLDVVSYCNGHNGFKVSPALCDTDVLDIVKLLRIFGPPPVLLLGVILSCVRPFATSVRRADYLALVTFSIDGLVCFVVVFPSLWMRLKFFLIPKTQHYIPTQTLLLAC
jgi:hypothetical protein